MCLCVRRLCDECWQSIDLHESGAKPCPFCRAEDPAEAHYAVCMSLA